MTTAIIGVGNIGGTVARELQALPCLKGVKPNWP
jgi:Trk K+ transport system NAD-binding subunit